MSQQGDNQPVDAHTQPARQRAADQDSAVRAVINHHAQLAADLNAHVESLLGLVESDQPIKAATVQRKLVDYARREILPHARAEEQALYPPAAALPQGGLLVDGMLAEHVALSALVDEITQADGRTVSLLRAAAAARALAALFASHLDKENNLILPLLVATDVSLTQLLAGMHELLGVGDREAQASGGCGCGGCGCGGDGNGSAAAAAAPVLSVDTRLDVRDVPHGQRHALVLSTVDALAPGQAVVLVASHAPRPVLAEIDDRFGGRIQAQWLQSGPDVWQVRLERGAALAG